MIKTSRVLLVPSTFTWPFPTPLSQSIMNRFQGITASRRPSRGFRKCCDGSKLSLSTAGACQSFLRRTWDNETSPADGAAVKCHTSCHHIGFDPCVAYSLQSDFPPVTGKATDAGVHRFYRAPSTDSCDTSQPANYMANLANQAASAGRKPPSEHFGLEGRLVYQMATRCDFHSPPPQCECPCQRSGEQLSQGLRSRTYPNLGYGTAIHD